MFQSGNKKKPHPIPFLGWRGRFKPESFFARHDSIVCSLDLECSKLILCGLACDFDSKYLPDRQWDVGDRCWNLDCVLWSRQMGVHRSGRSSNSSGFVIEFVVLCCISSIAVGRSSGLKFPPFFFFFFELERERGDLVFRMSFEWTKETEITGLKDMVTTGWEGLNWHVAPNSEFWKFLL